MTTVNVTVQMRSVENDQSTTMLAPLMHVSAALCARSGGMELLFNNEPVHHLVLPRYYQPATTVQATTKLTTRPEPIEESAEGAQETDVRFLIWWLREFQLEDRDRPELFSQGETVYVSRRCLLASVLD